VKKLGKTKKVRKHIITILFCMLAMVAAAQEDPTDNQSD
jgi:hypothetical protein